MTPPSTEVSRRDDARLPRCPMCGAHYQYATHQRPDGSTVERVVHAGDGCAGPVEAVRARRARDEGVGEQPFTLRRARDDDDA